jgi:predicted Zn-dependent protease
MTHCSLASRRGLTTRGRVSSWATLLAIVGLAAGTGPDPVADFNAGMAAEGKGDLQAAAGWFDRAQRTVPAWALPKLELAEVLLDEGGAPDRALSLLAAAQKLEPRNPRLFHLWGLALTEKGNAAGAEVSERTALSLRPDFPEAQAALAQALWAQGKRDEALGLWSDLCLRHPEDLSMRAMLVDRYLDSGRGVEAEKALRGLVTAQPKNPIWHRRLARTLEAEGLEAEAASERQRAAALSGGPTPKRKLRRLPDSKR